MAAQSAAQGLTTAGVAATCAAILLIQGCSRTVNLDDPNAPVAWVNNEPIVMGEYRPYLDQKRVEVFAEFRRNDTAVVDRESFWRGKIGGVVPLELARRRALDAAVRMKAEQLEAKRLGILKDISYKALKDSLAVRIGQYRAAKRENRVVYGPEPEESSYVPTVRSQMKAIIMDKLKDSTLQVRQWEIKGYHYSHEADYKKRDTIVFELIRIPLSPRVKPDQISGEDSLPHADSLRNILRPLVDKMDHDIRAGVSFGEIAARYKNAGVVFTTECYPDRGRFHRAATDLNRAAAEADRLAVGSASGAIELSSSFAFVKLLSRVDAGYRPIEQCAVGIAEMIRESKYEKYVDWIAYSAKARINAGVYKRLDR